MLYTAVDGRAGAGILLIYQFYNARILCLVLCGNLSRTVL